MYRHGMEAIRSVKLEIQALFSSHFFRRVFLFLFCFLHLVGGHFFFAHIWCSLCVLKAAILESLRNTTCLLSCTVVLSLVSDLVYYSPCLVNALSPKPVVTFSERPA